jgi:ABC-type amino acid transport system permease subunit
LSQIEARTDKRTLSAIGAPRSFRAKLVSIQALSLTAVGSILGALTGLMLGAAMLNGMGPEMANFPVWQLVALIVGVPALASTAFWLFTPRTLKYEVRQALD